MKEVSIESSAVIYDSYESFDEDTLQLFEAAHQACKRAYAPYSKFFVGASVRLANGQIVSGNNQENAVYPCGLCAERVALFQASSLYPDVAVKAIAVTIDYERVAVEDIAFPCGSCRQVIMEYEQKFPNSIDLYMLGKNEQVVYLESVKQLLPFAFTGDLLK